MSHPQNLAPDEDVASPPRQDVPANGRPVEAGEDAVIPGPAELAGRLDAAWDAYRSSADAMGRAAEAMREAGTPPDYRLIHTLGECHRQYLRLRNEAVARARSLGRPVPPPEHLAGLAGLHRLIDALARAGTGPSHTLSPADAEPPTHPPTESAFSPPGA